MRSICRESAREYSLALRAESSDLPRNSNASRVAVDWRDALARHANRDREDWDMSTYFTEENSAEAVNARMGEHTDPRLREVMGALVRHLHAFAKEVQLTQAEWDAAIDFLTRTGQLCSRERQEFILLSDTLGFSMLVDAINHRRPQGATENTVFGPFHVQGAPERAMGDCISLDSKGESCLFEGSVQDLDGNPVAQARLDVWCDNADGFYDVQQPGVQPQWNNRGIFTTGADGRYRFIGIKPVSYPIPHDGPVGQMLERLGRHPWRPAHLHFLVTAPGYQKVVTHTFVGDNPWLASDAVFGVKQSLVVPCERVEGGETVWRSQFDFVLTPQ
jgi:hydroxyquinol 1,2-dioxygenase